MDNTTKCYLEKFCLDMQDYISRYIVNKDNENFKRMKFPVYGN